MRALKLKAPLWHQMHSSPFRDGIEAASKAGIKAIIHPGGSIRDDDIIAAANEHNIAMVFTGMRHFKH